MSQIPVAGSARTVAVLCWIAVILDGFDLVVLGALIPVLTGGATPWMTAAEATFVSTISLVGMTLGALSIGIATDKIGRRKAMLWAVGSFSVLTLACAFVSDATQLGVLRFFAGIGLGGCLPTAIAMVTEFARGMTGKASTRVMTGYHVGAVATALLGLVLMPAFGWRAMFVAGAVPGLILLPAMLRLLPESPSFLVAKGRRAEAETIAAAYGVTLAPPAPAEEKASTGSLFRAPFLRNSVLIWVTSFMGLLLVYGLNTWLPKLMMSAGYGLSGGLWLLLMLNVGAVCGLLVAGQVGDRIGLKPAAVLWFLCGAVLLGLLSVKMSPVLLYPAVFLTGCFVFSAQVLVYAYTASNHPPGVRATALGMSAGVGRLGAISGPLLGGTLVSLGLGHPWGFYIFALVGFLGAVALSLTRVLRQKA
ncbi:MFS transporter [Paenirhodobacter enshiensis]|uniref:Major facilitator transporter n=1 Tax=Paenirhodobacter enshiensis TaxID=1105367 RepID=A0A086XXU6_9RHOB|nr:aromatic acid/H+ symport family MFS transporter [Paenirhodobacter enshiensis]KFI26846.1 major facilitator transporter [Paenirhodobacter enshiensis]